MHFEKRLCQKSEHNDSKWHGYCNNNVCIVITSYSIHYTKLYDRVIEEISEKTSKNNYEGINELFGNLTELSATIVDILTALSSDSLVTFTPELSVGVKKFDEHHKKLFSIINKLSNAIV